MTEGQNILHLLICVILATGMAVCAFLFLFLKVPSDRVLRNYRACRKIMALQYLSYTLGASAAVAYRGKLGNELELYMSVGLIFTSFQITIGAFALATLVNADFLKRRTVILGLTPTLIFSVLLLLGLIGGEASDFRKIVYRLFIAYGAIQLIFAARLVLKEVRGAMERADNFFSGREVRFFSWIRPIVALLVVDGALSLLCFVVSFWLLTIIALIFSGAVFFIVAVKFLNYVHDFELLSPVIAPERGVVGDRWSRLDEDNKYRSSKLAGVDVEKSIQRLDSLMRTAKPYLDPELTIRTLSRKLTLPCNQVSELINSELGMNFCNYVNSFRIGEVKRLFAEDTESNILDVALRSGFNSKSSFNAAFIKDTGMTPREWRRLQTCK